VFNGPCVFAALKIKRSLYWPRPAPATLFVFLPRLAMAATPSPSVDVALEPKRSLHHPPAVAAPKPTVADAETALPAPKRTRKTKATEKPSPEADTSAPAESVGRSGGRKSAKASAANAVGAEAPESCRAILKKFLLSYYEEKGGANFQTASLPPAYYDKLFEGVAKIIEGGETRAVANGRKIPQPHDLGQ